MVVKKPTPHKKGGDVGARWKYIKKYTYYT